MKTSAFALVGFGSVLFAGCTGVTPSAQTQRRIQEKPEVFSALDATQKNDVLGGAIERGFSADMVYLALGKPNKVVTSADGVKAMWVYQEYSSTGGTVTTSFNNPNASHYIPLYTSPSAPVGNDEGMNMSGATPGHSEGLPGYTKAASFTTARGPNLSQSLPMPELKQKTVYVFFVSQRVAEIKLEGDASDQRAVATNVAPPHRN